MRSRVAMILLLIGLAIGSAVEWLFDPFDQGD